MFSGIFEWGTSNGSWDQLPYTGGDSRDSVLSALATFPDRFQSHVQRLGDFVPAYRRVRGIAVCNHLGKVAAMRRGPCKEILAFCNVMPGRDNETAFREGF